MKITQLDGYLTACTRYLVRASPFNHSYDMRFADVPKYLKITQTQLAEILGKKKANLHQYISGRRGGNTGEVLTTLCEKTGLMTEQVIFPDVTGNQHGKNENNPAYWLNLAHEAVEQAKLRGLYDSVAHTLKADILSAAELESMNL